VHENLIKSLGFKVKVFLSVTHGGTVCLYVRLSLYLYVCSFVKSIRLL